MEPPCILLINVICFVLLTRNADCKIWNILDQGAMPTTKDISTCNTNSKIIKQLLNNQLQSGDTLLIPNKYEFWFNGGIYVYSINNITIQIDGSINYQNDRKYWPTQSNSDLVLEAMRFENSNNITFTSSNKMNKGLIHGNGKKWWGALNYCIYKENRPRLLHIYNSTQIMIEYIYFKDSPYWNVYLQDVKNVEIHHSNISAKRDDKDDHDLFDITAFNTDGFDVSGENIHIHHVSIFNQDDCIAVKSQSPSSQQSNCSRNMLFEHINASGLGLTIGSIGANDNNCVDNITFRDVYMDHTWKGIYMKSAPGHGPAIISNILYENIIMDEPSQVPIWMGPQQAIYNGQCSLLWPQDPMAKCPVTAGMTWINITLRNILINNPKQSPGVILGNNSNPMQNIIFDNVIVNNPGHKPWGDQYYKCEGVKNLVIINRTNPVPPCASSKYTLLSKPSELSESLDSIPGYAKFKKLIQCLERVKGKIDESISNVEGTKINGWTDNQNARPLTDDAYQQREGFINNDEEKRREMIMGLLSVLLCCSLGIGALFAYTYPRKRNIESPVTTRLLS